MANRNINGDVNVEFNEASSRQGLDSGESVKILFGKVRKWLSDLKPVAFSGSYNDLTNKPSIPPAVAVKGNAETAYRTGNVNLTASDIGLDPLGYYGICGRTTNTSTNPWVLVAETTSLNNNNTGITLLFDYTFTEANNATSTGTGILSVSVRVNANGAIITNRSYAKWLTKMNELNNDDVIITYNNSTKSLQIWGKSDNPYKVMRVRPLSGSDRFNTFDISKWTFTTSLNTNMYESYPTGDGITVLTPTCDMQEQINYNTHNGVKNLLNVNWFKTNAKSGQLGTVESLNIETGSVTGYAPASSTGAYNGISIMDIANQILENGKKYILSCTVDSLTNDGIFGFRQVSNNAFITPINITRTGKYTREYTHDSSVPVFISFCINTTGTSADKRIALSNVMLREATIADDTFEPYAEPNSRLTQKVDKALEQTGYNMLEVPQATKTHAGVTFTTDAKAGTITANGTATSDAYIDFYIEIPAGTYVFSNSGNTEILDTTGDSFVQLNGTTIARGNDRNPGNTFTIAESSSLRIGFRIHNSYTAQNFVFKPMIVPIELTGIPFQPYAKSNAELTQDLNDISEELDCLVIRAALVNNEVRIQNTSDFTDDLYGKYYSETEPKFAILELHITSNTYYYKALINCSSVRQALVMEASFIEVNGTYMSIYKFNWSLSGTVGTPTVSYTSLNLGS